ncbi:MAG: deoxyribonuclease IV [Chloroflexota bacterium]|nr:deoxyribonuclease IV [Chloroflexota bacterium]
MRIRIGAQVSSAGGVSRGVERAVAMGADVVQVFVDPNRRFPRAPLPADELDRLRDALRDSGLPGYVHAPYLANVATADALLRDRSIDMIGRALRAAAHAGLRGVVVHPGSHLGRGFGAVRDQLLRALGEGARPGGGEAFLLLENQAGAGGQVGATVGELRALLDGLDGAGARAGICLDTQHAHAAGWDLSKRTGVDRFAREWRSAGLLDRVELVHANDSGSASGSHRDLHANPGEGSIGAHGFRALAKLPELSGVPWVLEVPGVDRSGPRREEIDRLRKILR